MTKKEYIKPEMIVVDMDFKTNLLAASSAEDTGGCDNPWWCDNQPSADDWWKKD